jgi:predicted flap endonuclease-1-like 5' DNA nuclease
MNHTAKNLVRLAGVIVGLGAAAWALRDRLLPAPEIHDEPPPRFREATRPETAVQPAGSLTDIKGVGPVTAEKLETAGFSSLGDIAASDAGTLSEAVGVSEAIAAKWIASAATLT